MMTVRYLPGVGNSGLFFTTAGKGTLYLLDSLGGTVKEVYDAGVGEGHCVLTQPFRNTSRILMSIYTSNQVRRSWGVRARAYTQLHRSVGHSHSFRTSWCSHRAKWGLLCVITASHV
jgi:hypothetical protein